MGNRHNLLAAVSVVALGGAAHADDMAAREVLDWTGFYVGAGGGANFVFSGLVLDDSIVNTQAASKETSATRGFGTIELGADYQLDSNFVIGAIANFDFGGHPKLGSANLDTANAEWEAGNSWGVGARIGYLPSPRMLIYGVGGFTQLEVSTDLLTGTSPATRDDKWASGYFVGAGVEILSADNLSLKLEYRFSRYDELSATQRPINLLLAPMPPGPGAICDHNNVCHTSADIDDQSVRATLTWKLGR